MDTDVMDELAGLEDAWDEADVRDPKDFSPLPDGTYQAFIDEARLERAKESKRLQVAWTFVVLSPEQYDGRKVWHYRGIDADDPEQRKNNVKWLKQEIYNCGVDITGKKIVDLPEILPALINRIVEIRLKTSIVKAKNAGDEDRKYSNVYINKLLSEGNGMGATIPTSAPEPEQDSLL